MVLHSLTWLGRFGRLFPCELTPQVERHCIWVHIGSVDGVNRGAGNTTAHCETPRWAQEIASRPRRFNQRLAKCAHTDVEEARHTIKGYDAAASQRCAQITVELIFCGQRKRLAVRLPPSSSYQFLSELPLSYSVAARLLELGHGFAKLDAAMFAVLRF